MGRFNEQVWGDSGERHYWLHTEHDADRVRSDNRGDPGPVVCAATTYLADAGDTAHELADLLNSAQQYLATLGATEPRSINEDRIRRDKDLADNLAAGPETGWWDEQGRPAPWPDDFFDEDSDWCVGGSDHPPIELAPGQPPF